MNHGTIVIGYSNEVKEIWSEKQIQLPTEKSRFVSTVLVISMWTSII